MNRKNAFTVAAILRRKMAEKTESNAINVTIVGNSLAEALMFQAANYGKNIVSGNRPILN